MCAARTTQALNHRPGCRAAAIKQMLTPWLRRLLALLSRVSPPPPSPPRSPRRTRIIFCNGAYSTSSHRPILTPGVPEAERPARSPDMQPRSTRVSLNAAIPTISRDYVDRRRSGHPLVHAPSSVPFSFPPLLPAGRLIRLPAKFSRIVPRLSHLEKLANSR